ncbi:glucosaminidase domain-containing protein [Metabacillus endolithicus]|uniref:glucosaminidase domain-containing protein n=1 Tax=Metabacillus endolithicus TaxID=1535204 RepID=UPI001FF83087|nr:glucosaminidase domain-containing protein [Metabacillus endolithicus]UPG65201.1 glucosaminidase domain-containing protein [Metabacillus endolithicus]
MIKWKKELYCYAKRHTSLFPSFRFHFGVKCVGSKFFCKSSRFYNNYGSFSVNVKANGRLCFIKRISPKLTSVSIYQLAELYLEIGRKEGVRGDIAFAQAIHETGFFRFGGDVIPEQNNYAGIGTTGGGVKGAFFATPEEGVRAHIQHLKAYASKEPLNTVLIDPRFNLVTRGIAPLWTDLNGRWAVPGKGYGEKILQIHLNMSKMTLTIPHVSLPTNHKQPVARITIKADVPMLAPDGSVFKTLKKGEKVRVYGVIGNSYDVGGGYRVDANSSKMSIYIGRILIKNSTTVMYKPDGTVHRVFKKGESLMVYDYDSSVYQVGGGYYVKMSDKPVYHLGRLELSKEAAMFSPDGTPYSNLKAGGNYPVYGINGDRLDVGGGYTVQFNKKQQNYYN